MSSHLLITKIYNNISDIGSTDKSKEDCINGKSIDNCWFSLSKVIPEVSSQNLTVLYEDDTVSNI